MREAHRLQFGVALRAVRHLLLGPGEETAAMQFKEGTQAVRVGVLCEQRLLLAAHVEVHQCQPHRRQPAREAQQMAVNLQLRPVQLAVVVRHARQVAAEGLDFLQLVLLRVVAVRAAAHVQRAESAGQAYFLLVAVAAP
ncbi:hypothetical protein [Pseudoduganella sp. UC29_71]|uniref:hypothetical protein n=1 Tax=Pseudoduganella sp. UC29_71 TaxID=3350174 RepID=UPI003671EC78